VSVSQVSVYLQNWSHVLSYVNKAESTPEIAEVSVADEVSQRRPKEVVRFCTQVTNTC